jgi:hypothetical protein
MVRHMFFASFFPHFSHVKIPFIAMAKIQLTGARSHGAAHAQVAVAQG